MANQKTYELDIKIAGAVDSSLLKMAGLTKQQMQQIALAARQAQLAQNDFYQNVQKAAPFFTTLEKAGTRAFRRLATSAVFAFQKGSQVIGNVVDIGKEFESQMATVEAIAEVPIDQMEEMTDKARELGRQTVFTATEVGKGMEYLALAGWDSEEIQNGIDGIVALSAASGEELSTVSEIMADSLSAFNMEAKETERMADTIAAAALNSNTNVFRMGQSFQYVAPVAGALGFTAEDTALALGLLANNGIKASKAGTSLRTLMTKLAGDVEVVGDSIGTKLINASVDGKMRPLIDIINDLRNAFSGLSEVEKVQNANKIAGLRGMPGLLAIVNASENDLQKLYAKILNADEANTAQKAADVRFDTLAGDITKFRDALNDLYITAYYGANSPLRDGVQWFTNLINSINEGLGNGTLLSDFKEKFNTTQFKNITSYLDTILNIAKGFKPTALSGLSLLANSLPMVTGALVSFFTAVKTYKMISVGLQLYKYFILMGNITNPVILGITAFSTAIGVLTAALIYYKKAEKQAIDNNLAKHFGDISLSLSDLQQAAGNILKRDLYEDVLTAVSAFDELDSIASSIDSSVATINKLNWKTSVGMSLTLDEQDTYKDAIDAYVKSMNEYASQQSYAVTLNLSTYFGSIDDLSLENGGIGDKVSGYYVGLTNELSNLGTELGKTVNKAFNDNILDIDEVGAISKIQQQMADIQAKLATSEYEAKMQMLGDKYGYGDLTVGSFRDLVQEVQKQNDELNTAFDESETKARASIINAYNGGALTPEEYKTAIDAVKGQSLNNTAQTLSSSASTLTDALLSNYRLDLYQLRSGMQSIYNQYSSDEYRTDWQTMPETQFANMTLDANTLVGGTTKKSVQSMLDDLAPTIEEIENVKKQYNDLGMEIPEEIAKGFSQALSDYDALKALSGDDESIGNMFLQLMMGDDNFSEIFANTPWLNDMAESLNTSYKATMEPVISGMFAWSNDEIKSYYDKGFDAEADLRLNLTPQISGLGSLGSTITGILQNTRIGGALGTPSHHADGGIVNGLELSWLGERGPESVIPLDGSRRAVSLWQQAGDILSRKSSFDTSSMASNGGAVITYSPNIVINGNASREDVLSANREAQDEFEYRMNQWLKNNRRVSFAG